MGTAQYEFWINQAALNRSQKLKLGWTPPEKEPDRAGDLFTHFTAVAKPDVPKAGDAVTLEVTWPKGASVRSFTLRTQTELLGAWAAVKTDAKGTPPARVSLGTFENATPVSYRIDVTLDDGQSVELWGYFQVKK